MLNHWWRQLVRRFGYRLKAPHRSQSLARSRGYRPRLETLEDRTLMTAGILDSAFGSAGIVTTNVGLGDDFAGAVAAQTNGRILVAGYGVNGNGDQDVVLARYTSTGALDTSFGGTGVIRIDLGTDEFANAIVIQDDGKIVVGGYRTTAGDSDFLLLRFNTNGTLDATFGSSGIAAPANFGGTEDVITALAIRPSDQFIVAVGTTNAGGDSDFAVAVYDTSGALDNGFSGDGMETVDVAATDDDVAFGVGIDAAENIVVVGSTFNGSDNDFAVARLDATGTLDAGFDGDGIVTTDVSAGADDVANAVAFLSGGQIVVGGFADMGGTGEDFALVMYDPADGSLDNSFGTNGIVTTDFRGGNDIISAIRVDLNDQIVAVGSAFAGGVSTDSQFALARYISDGSLDFDFGIEATGKVTNSFGVASALGTAVAFDSLGRILAAGYADNDPDSVLTNYDLALTRYLVADPFVLTPINEDPGANPPSSLLVDIVQGTVGAVAVIGLSGTESGTWQYSTNGTTFINFGTVSETAARLLVANTTTRIRFLPSANFNGEVGFSFVAWDQTVGTAGGVFDTTLAPAAFGGESVGAQLSVLPVNDAPVFIAGTPATILLEGSAIADDTVTFTVESFADALIFDVDGDPKGIAITAVTGNNATTQGVWQFSTDGGTTFINFGTTSTANGNQTVGTVSATLALPLRAQDLIRYDPVATFSGTVTFTFRAWDDTVGSAGTKQNPAPAGGSGGFSTTTKTASMPVGRNVAPVLAAGTPKVTPADVDDVNPGLDTNPAGSTVESLLGSSVTDTPNSLQGIAIITATQPASSGTWQFALAETPTVWTAFGPGSANPVSATTALHLRAEDLVRFLPILNYTATTATISARPTITYRAWDQTGTAEEGDFAAIGTVTSTSPYSTGTQVASALVNRAPTLDVNNTVLPAVNEDTTFTSATLTGFVTVDDVGTNAGTTATTGFAIIDVTGNGTWSYANTATGTFSPLAISNSVSDSAAKLIAANARLRFTPAKNFNGTATITLVAWDRTAGALNGTINLNALDDSDLTAFSDVNTPVTLTLTINPVNDAPVLSSSKPLTKIPPNSAGGIGDAVSAFTTISDVDGDPKGIAIIGVTGTNRTTQGTWQYSLDGGSGWTAFPSTTANTTTVSASSAVLLPPTARVRFVPVAGFTGTVSITFRAWDGSEGTPSAANIGGNATGINISTLGTGGVNGFSTATKSSSLRVAL